MKSRTILVVDDTVQNLDIVSELLDGYDVIDAISGKDALEVVVTQKIDLILLDIMMPEMDGYEVCQKLKENRETKDIPIIFITAKTDGDSIERAYDVGGIDYITKPFQAKELQARVKREFQLQDLQQELQLLASIDPMTKLYNRRYFVNIAAQTLSLMQREKQDFSLIMLDIDKFKSVNDTYGHSVGDDVIKSLANILLDTQRKSDISCRYGGEEFVVLLPNTSLNGAKILADNIRKKIEQSSVSIDALKEVKFTASFGVAQVDTQNAINIEEALNAADAALYRAKRDGRNRVES